jgi:hypothetical protein
MRVLEITDFVTPGCYLSNISRPLSPLPQRLRLMSRQLSGYSILCFTPEARLELSGLKGPSEPVPHPFTDGFLRG